MKQITTVLGLVFLVSFLWARTNTPEAMPTLVAADETASDLMVEVLYCHDGDTCRINIGGSLWTNIRLAGIDAPEVKGRDKKSVGQPMGEEAKAFLNELTKGKKVRLRQTDLDPFNRLVCEIYLGDQNVNGLLVEKGLAEVYRGKVKRLNMEPYFRKESEAQKQKVGIWALKDYQSPSAYRKAGKKGQEGS